jgi:2-hydroxychromene-2-carboxylate isomerase
MRATIDFYFDFLSPFAYLARGELLKIAERHDCAIAWHAIDLMAVKKAAGNTGPGNRDMPVKLAYMKVDIARWVAAYGVPFTWVGNYASRKMNIGALYARERGAETTYVRDAFHAGWGAGGKLDDPDLLRRLAQMQGWDGDDFLRYVASPEAAAVFEAGNTAAIARGVFGVPTMLLGDDMWWGNDRLVMLEKALAARR